MNFFKFILFFKFLLIISMPVLSDVNMSIENSVNLKKSIERYNFTCWEDEKEIMLSDRPDILNSAVVQKLLFDLKRNNKDIHKFITDENIVCFVTTIKNDKFSLEYIKNRAKKNRINDINADTFFKGKSAISVDSKSIKINNNDKVIYKKIKTNNNNNLEQLIIVGEELLIAKGNNATSCASIGGIGQQDCQNKQ